MYYKKAKQAEIEKLGKKVIFEEVEIDKVSDRTDYVNRNLIELSEIFDEDTDFRPHYFFVHALLENVDHLLLVKSVNVIQAIKTYLKGLEKEDVLGTKAEYKGLCRYVLDEQFCYNVDMFVEALIYECTFRKNVLKNEAGISQATQKIDLLGHEPKKQIEDEFLRFANTLDSYSRSFEDKLAEAKTINENTERISTEAKQISKDAKQISEDAKQASEDAKAINKTTVEISNKAKETSDKAKETSDTVNDKIKKVEDNANNLLTNVLTILGIFVAIIFAIVAAYFTIAAENKSAQFSNVVQVNLGRFVLMGQVLFDLLFLFMHMISKLSGKSIALACLGCDNSVCKKGKCTFPMRLMNRYPYVIVTNFVAVGIYIVLTAWWFLEEFVYRAHYEKLHSAIEQHPFMFSCAVITICILLIAVPIKLMINYSKKKKTTT